VLPMLESHPVRIPHIVQQFELYALHTIDLRDLYDFLDVIAYPTLRVRWGHRSLLNGPQVSGTARCKRKSVGNGA
jgi:hypothetical protein